MRGVVAIIGTDVCRILTAARLALDLGWNYVQDEEFLEGQDI